jgi:hypothetical protein
VTDFLFLKTQILLGKETLQVVWTFGRCSKHMQNLSRPLQIAGSIRSLGLGLYSRRLWAAFQTVMVPNVWLSQIQQIRSAVMHMPCFGRTRFGSRSEIWPWLWRFSLVSPSTRRWRYVMATTLILCYQYIHVWRKNFHLRHILSKGMASLNKTTFVMSVYIRRLFPDM